MLNEYGLFNRETEERLASRTEADVYAAMDLPFIAPPLREDTGEVDAAVAGALPQVVLLTDIVGDLHGHSDWSGDGKATLEEMVAAAAERGYAYWAVTDHAENLTMNGLTRERMLERRIAIAQLQERYEMRILEGAELNIGADGDVDYDPEFLPTMDWNVASIHTLMTRSGAEQTRRIVTAMENPAVHAIGHLTGRQIGKRPPYDVDLDAILEAAVRTGTALEINASPRRLDLSGDMVRRAVDAGVTLTISCDAHSVGDLASMRYGVGTAQRGWATAADVLNCQNLQALVDFTAAKRA
jgi:DNA polymerase (family 10)